MIERDAAERRDAQAVAIPAGRTLLDMNAYQWTVLFAAWLGWGFDIFDSLLFNYVAPNAVLLFKYSYAFVALPGGFGTLDELAEALTLVQTGKVDHFPIVLIGTEYWRPFRELLERMTIAGAISTNDRDLVLVTDDLEEASRYIRANAIARFGLRHRYQPSPLLSEPSALRP